jgi:hypothetical protein
MNENKCKYALKIYINAKNKKKYYNKFCILLYLTFDTECLHYLKSHFYFLCYETNMKVEKGEKNQFLF